MDMKYKDKCIYYKKEDEVQAKLTYEKVGVNEININHTFVSEKLRGLGVASKLMVEAMHYFDKKGYRVKASCSYAYQWIKKHEEYNGMIADDFDDSILQCKIVK